MGFGLSGVGPKWDSAQHAPRRGLAGSVCALPGLHVWSLTEPALPLRHRLVGHTDSINAVRCAAAALASLSGTTLVNASGRE